MPSLPLILDTMGSSKTVAMKNSGPDRREKVAALRAAEQRQRGNRYLAIGAVAAVVLILVALVIVKVATGQHPAAAKKTSAATAAVVSKVASIPASVFDTVGAGSVTAPLLPIHPALPTTSNGKPLVLYVGAEYCPYCAAERWAVVAALSRFGTFTGLGETSSSSSDVYPSTATLSFHGASYTSPYLSFRGYETESNQRQGNGYAPLETLPPADQAIFDKIDAPPYVPASSAGGIPFVDFGGHTFISGATYNPGILQGLTHQQIANSLAKPSSAVAKGVDGSANVITAALCRLTGDKPANVCASAGVRAAATKAPAP